MVIGISNNCRGIVSKTFLQLIHFKILSEKQHKKSNAQDNITSADAGWAGALRDTEEHTLNGVQQDPRPLNDI